MVGRAGSGPSAALLGFLVAVIPACHEAFPYQGRVDAAAALPDSPVTPASDRPYAVEARPDILSPDIWPRFSSTACKSLWLGAPVIPVSTENDGVAAGRPALAVINGDFYVVYAEAGIRVHRIAPTGSVGATVVAPLALDERVPVAATAGPAGKLGLVWRSTTGCPSTLQRIELPVPWTGTAVPPPVRASPNNCAMHGYGAPSVVFTGTHYLVASPLEYSCSATHHKWWLQFLSGGDNDSTTCYGGPGAGTTTFSAVLEPLQLSAPYRYALAYLYRPEGQTTPFTIPLYRATGSTSSAAAWAPWPSTSGVSPGLLQEATARDHRPALAWDGADLWIGWSNDTGKIATRRCPWAAAASVPPSCDGLKTFAPSSDSPTRAYAHPSVAHSAAHAVSLMAYTVIDSDVLKPQSLVAVVKLAESGLSSPTPAEQVVHVASSAPRFTTLARHDEGFGLVWVEDRLGTAEVYFKWLGCMP